MEYPVWQLSTLAGGFWIALIATTHVFVSQFAVGGGLFLVLSETKARRENSPEILDFVRKHTKFFLLLTMVFGGISGVGIWFTISVLAPGATSTLIHIFVWGWATEWVFFIGEIVALLVYHYRFDRLSPRDHLLVGWVYFLFAWLSLFVINGVIGFMLTPGQWATTGNFWDGFLNPTFWSSLVFRSFLAFMLAGLFGFCTALRIPDEKTRHRMTQTCALWALVSLPFLLASGIWYLRALPPDTLDFITRRSREITPYFASMPWIAAGLMAGGLLIAMRLPRGLRKVLALLLLIGGFLFVGAFEFTREAGRKPFIIHGHTWAQGVRVAQAGKPGEPFLPRAKWSNKDAKDRLAMGKELFNLQCISCHSVGGPMNDIRKVTANVATIGMEAYLTGQGLLFTHMPPFLGDANERRALAEYITVEINKRKPDDHATVEVKPLVETPAPFNAEKDEYVLLAWNTLGMKCISDADAFFTLLPPGNALNAVLYKRGDTPELVPGGQVELEYQAPAGFKNPSAHVEFWKHAPSLIGKALAPNVSAAGRGMDGAMAYNEKSKTFEAIGIPVVPYDDNGTVNPYPVFTVTAKEKGTGKVLAQTKTVAPVGSEMGCRNCHGGEWRKNNATGISAQTAKGVLRAHDSRSGTTLEAQAAAGKPVLCQSCHPDPLLNAKGDPARLNLPAAIHGFHVAYLTGQGEEVCSRCHPDSPTGVTRCLRDNHAAKGIGCNRCHGFLEDHALSLLQGEKKAGKARADLYMAHIKPRLVANKDAVAPRSPWLQEPDCLTCHKDDSTPDVKKSSAYNTWTAGPAQLYRSRKDATGAVPCIACHGAPHAAYPANNAYGKDRDNLQPLQYQGAAGAIGAKDQCKVCHLQEMPMDMHHPEGVTMRSGK
jgi:mono/diheme cytochrome c family protein